MYCLLQQLPASLNILGKSGSGHVETHWVFLTALSVTARTWEAPEHPPMENRLFLRGV